MKPHTWMGTILAINLFIGQAAAQDAPFATTKEQIIEALQGKDGTKTIDGVRYEVKQGKVYKVLPNGMKVKMRGLGGIVQAQVSPRVALQVEFRVDSDEPVTAGRRALAELGGALVSKSLQGSRFQIAGHTDSDGDEKYNLELSRRRAERVRAILVKEYGIPVDTLTVEAFGESHPVAPNESEEGKARNRRVEITRLLRQ